jgi:hypothetical protein
MIINIEGSTENKRKYIKQAAKYFEKLLFKRKIPTLVLNVELIHNLKKKETREGDCVWEDRRTKPRVFTVRLDSNTHLSDLIETFGHEMVHVKQYARGELKDHIIDHDTVYWYGEEYDSSKFHYYDWPWEIEAAGRERGLYIRYMEEFDYSREKWAKYFI